MFEFFSNAAATGTYAGSFVYMSPQVAKRKEYDYKTDVWSVGWVFYNVMTLQFPFVNPLEFGRLNPADVPIPPNSQYESLRDCICNKMIIPDDKQRGSIADVIADAAFQNFYHLTEAKAISWMYQEAIEEMSDRLLDAKQVHLQNQVDRQIAGLLEATSRKENRWESQISDCSRRIETTDRNLQDQINGLTRQVESRSQQSEAKDQDFQNQINGLTRQVETAVQLVTNFADELERKQVQLEEEVAERKKLKEKVEELQQKLNLSEQQRQQWKCRGECEPDFQPKSDDEVC